MEEKGQTGIQLNHLFLNIKTTVKTVSSYKKKGFVHLLFCVLGENFTGEAGHHVQDVIIELFREPGAIDILKNARIQMKKIYKYTLIVLFPRKLRLH